MVMAGYDLYKERQKKRQEKFKEEGREERDEELRKEAQTGRINLAGKIYLVTQASPSSDPHTESDG